MRYVIEKSEHKCPLCTEEVEILSAPDSHRQQWFTVCWNCHSIFHLGAEEPVKYGRGIEIK